MPCPNCGEPYSAGESVCRKCGTTLPAASADQTPRPHAAVVAVMRTTKRGLLPLASMTLDQHGIEYTVLDSGIADQIVGYRSTESIGETESPLEVLVRAEDADRARDLLRDLEMAEAGGAAVPPVSDTVTPAEAAVRARAAAAATPGAAVMSGAGTIELVDAATGTPLGRITEAQLETLAEHLEEESSDDDDYYIDGPTLTMLEERQVDPSLLALLRSALGSREGMDIRWLRQ